VLSYVAGGVHWQIVPYAPIIEVTVPTYAGRPRRDGIVVHRQQLPAAHTTVHRGIPVTTPIRTLLDLASVLSLNALAKCFEQAQVRLQLPPAPLAAEVISRPRHRGNAKLRRILAGAVDPTAVRSVLELRFLRLCAAYGIPRPEVNVRIGPWTPDFLWPDLRGGFGARLVSSYERPGSSSSSCRSSLAPASTKVTRAPLSRQSAGWSSAPRGMSLPVDLLAASSSSPGRTRTTSGGRTPWWLSSVKETVTHLVPSANTVNAPRISRMLTGPVAWGNSRSIRPSEMNTVVTAEFAGAGAGVADGVELPSVWTSGVGC
jgi:hypothetical protein